MQSWEKLLSSFRDFEKFFLQTFIILLSLKKKKKKKTQQRVFLCPHLEVEHDLKADCFYSFFTCLIFFCRSLCVLGHCLHNTLADSSNSLHVDDLTEDVYDLTEDVSLLPSLYVVCA